jgi:hypothetical protein
VWVGSFGAERGKCHRPLDPPYLTPETKWANYHFPMINGTVMWIMPVHLVHLVEVL